MKRVCYTLLAEQDLFGILEAIALDRPSAARKLAGRIRKKCESLGRTPNLGQSRPELPGGDLRITTVGKYVVVYRVHADDLQILRIVHGAREWEKLL